MASSSTQATPPLTANSSPEMTAKSTKKANLRSFGVLPESVLSFAPSLSSGTSTQSLLNDYTSDSSDQYELLSTRSSNMPPPASPLSLKPRKQTPLKEHRGRISLKYDMAAEPLQSHTHSRTSTNSSVKSPQRTSFNLHLRKRSADKATSPSAKSPTRSSFRLSLFFTLLRYPILAIILSIMGLDLTALVLVRIFVFLYERFVVSQGTHRKLLEILAKSESYTEWKVAASYLDSFMKHDEWKRQEDSNEIYNSKLIRKTTRKLRQSRLENNVKEVMKHLTHACKKNHGGCMNEALYSNTYDGTKEDVELLYQEIEETIEFVARHEGLKVDEKGSFFKSLSRNYGRAALSLSGGGSLTYYHMGVLKALFEEGLLPNVITGTSGGSLLAALVCTRTDEELASEGVFDAKRVVDKFTIMSDPWAVRIKRLLSDGYLFDPTEPFKKLEELTKGHLTFLEAYKKTGRILCISVVPDEPNHVTPAKVLNFMTAPDVLISSAICASCAIPLILPPIKLMCKTETGDFVPYRGSGKLWRDGSIRSDIPDLSMLNVTFQIVSQVNPHITIFFYESQGSAGCPTPHRGGRGWRGGFIASSLIHMIDLDLKKWLRLCKDLKLLPPIMATDVSSVFLQQFDGTVTILPANSNVFPDCVHILNDPTPERLQEYITQGQLKAFPKLGMIGHRMRIEKSVQKVRDVLLGVKGMAARRSVTRFSTTDLDD
ncbi:UNVERIFIED_CONTAM: hypothetical protein HDU68_000144 [Siphonaria sp. JEL0065]|nr:hypothetical protein HDU68_000144 [Siphonaria sp. JEL0065]